MALFPISSDLVQFSSDTPVSADQFSNGIRLKADGTVAYVATTGGAQTQNGFLLDANGAIVCVDATSGLPADVIWKNGLPFDSSGALCVSTNAASYYGNGIPYDSNGAIASTGAALPDPTTVNYTGAQIQAGFGGSLSTTQVAGRISGSASKTAWVGIITGTEAKLTSYQNSGTTATDGQIVVSVDGGAFTNAVRVGAVFTLFTGLAHGPHTVVWRYGSAFGDTGNVPVSTTALSVTGQPPSLVIPTSAYIQPNAEGSLSVATGRTTANSANFAPQLLVASVANIASVRLRGAFTRLFVAKNASNVWISKNGAAPTLYGPITEANVPVNGVIVSGLGGDVATYNVWPGDQGASGTSGVLAVAGDAALQDIGGKRRLIQFGDSITEGGNIGTTLRGYVEVFQVAAALSFAGGTCAIGGYTIAQLDTLLTTTLPQMTVTSNDVAILAIGRNNVGGAFDAAEIASYQSCISKLLAAGFGKVLCRGILPSGDRASLWAAENGSISSIVSGLANPNVIFIDTSACPTYTTVSNDKTHPDAAGYVVIGDFVRPLYATALGL